MPIGSSKIGVLGGLAPGGTETFNAPGTFSIPPGVRKVSITGRGGTGNPGVAGNPGNPGNPGSGGGGGGGGGSNLGIGCASSGIVAGSGGVAARPGMITRGTFNMSPSIPICPFYSAGTAPPSYINQITMGGDGVTPFDPGANPRAGQSGQDGNAGSAGSAGSSGNPGQPSSGLGNTFPGGAGGNAGVAGNAGTGGSAGGGGNRGNSSNVASPNNANVGNGGSGGTGGGSGGNGTLFTNPNLLGGGRMGGGGGGGAGATNSGSNGQPGTHGPLRVYALGGNDAQVSAPVNPSPGSDFWFQQGCPSPPIPTNIMGGSVTKIHGISSVRFTSKGFNMFNPTCSQQPGRVNLPQFSPLPLAPNVIRAGGGGGSSHGTTNDNTIFFGGGGGGGGGRGNAGNAGGSSPTPTGAAGTPSTFNCVPVTPGGTEPITVSTPGGQIVISWNPQ